MNICKTYENIFIQKSYIAMQEKTNSNDGRYSYTMAWANGEMYGNWRKTNKQKNKQTTNTYTKNSSIRNELSPVSVPWLNPPRRASRWKFGQWNHFPVKKIRISHLPDVYPIT